MKTREIVLVLSLVCIAIFGSCKKDDKKSSGADTYALVIQTGAQTVVPQVAIPYTAVLVDKNGTTTAPSSISWSVSNTTLGSFTGNTFTAAGIGAGTITATASVNGSNLTATVPIGVYNTTVFSVAPGAVIWSTNAGTIQLTPIYIGTGTTNYTYASSDANIVTVDNGGVITFKAAGSCTITVTATGLTGTPSVSVPVLVVGNPPITLPVARVAINPNAKQIFKGDNFTFSATAYDISNTQVSSTFTWTIQDPTVASIDANGKVTALHIGKTTVTATASGITGQAELDVLPDTAIVVTPYYSSIAPGNTQQFTATAYTVNHSNLNVSAITMPSGLQWTIPTYGLSMLDIANVDANGLVTMKSSATAGLSTVLLAQINGNSTIAPGAAMIIAAVATSCNCGAENASVDHITLSSSVNVSLSFPLGTAQINAAAVDAGGAPVVGATLVYCSDNVLVCNVDQSGNIQPTGAGTAHIKICVGSKNITVNVTVN
ncbi:MAG: Ig-like domain-containing protein [Bacteroidota bacterium]